ncbi:MAG: ABC transporter permease [Bacteroidales bacterium]|nr:ABC transporter permease [Bacteroidales bacterium]
MLKNFLISAIRNLSRNKFYTFLNVLGLSVGLAAFIFILLYVRDELTYDKHNEKHERIYRIESNFNISNRHDLFAIVPVPMGPAFKLEFPEVETFTRLNDVGNSAFRYGDKEYYETDFFFADSTVFDVFTIRFLIGSPEKALTEPFTMVLTESVARKYFGDRNPVGEIIISGSGRSYKVTGVIEDQPANSHLKYGALLSVMTLQEIYGADNFNNMEPLAFWNIGVYTYLLLHENSSMSTIMEKFPAFYEKYMKPVGDQINASFELLYTPLAGTHFAQGLGAEQPTGNMAYVYIFSAVAFFILLPDFNQLSVKAVHFSWFSQPLILAMIFAITLTVGIVSGSYPSFYLSSFAPVMVLKGAVSKTGKTSGLLRRILVVIQFFIAILMIIGTIVVSSQLRFLRNTDLGFDKNSLLVIEMQDSTFRSKAETLKNELVQHRAIEAATNCTGVPGQIEWIQVLLVEREDEMKEMALILAQVDFDYVATMGMEIVRGRDFDRNMGTDREEAVIINETAVRTLGWEDDPIGKKIQYGLNLNGDTGRPMKVIGVVKDFHFRSLHNKIEPVILFISPVPRYLMTVRMKEGMEQEALAVVEEKWNDFGAGRPFDYRYVTQIFEEQYQGEQKIGVIFNLATAITIFIALLGLLGLSSYIAEQRTKEIGIRKILGASVPDIMQLLYREFIFLILIAFVVAVPVAWWRLDIWLNDSFIYHTSLQWTHFLLAGVVSFLVGMVTISFYIVRVAGSNPVEAIKYE